MMNMARLPFLTYLLFAFIPTLQRRDNHTKLVFLEWSNLRLERNQMHGFGLLLNPGGYELSKCISVLPQTI